MTLAVCARTLQGQNGDTLGGAEVTVRVNATGDLADIFADRDGNTPAPNPITASATGTVEFYVTPGVYRLEAIGAGGEETQVVDLGGVSVIPVATISDLQALNTDPLPDGQQVSVAENGNLYTWNSSGNEWDRVDPDFSSVEAESYGGDGVTQSDRDTTSGRLLKTGDGGLLRESIGESIDDFNNAESSGFYSRFGVSNGPGGNGWSLLHLPRNLTRQFQLAGRSGLFSSEPSRMLAIRQSEDAAEGIWFPWRQVYHEGNIVGDVSEDAGIPTGAVIERGSNSNGEYVRFADGTQICWQEIVVPYHGSAELRAADVPFPAVFSSVPAIKHEIFDQSMTPAYTQIGTTPVGTKSNSSAEVRVFRQNGQTNFESGDTISVYRMTTGRWF